MKRKLRRIRELLVQSRYTLEQASKKVPHKWLGDLLFTLSCRRVIMVNELDRELGQLHLPAFPTGKVHAEIPTTPLGVQHFVQACQAEEKYLEVELEEMRLQPGLHGRTRDSIATLLSEIRANMKDILFLRENHSALQH